ncbi:MAG: hypothetical protein AUJ75_03445 [Candidatus Omnitrophica bacterium CG1_02_49_10]|nr:MAG: hypothetical protein AUJ75_03445 [Candidatus Omnitrophica bacterium CG1_02_49_10]
MRKRLNLMTCGESKGTFAAADIFKYMPVFIGAISILAIIPLSQAILGVVYENKAGIVERKVIEVRREVESAKAKKGVVEVEIAKANEKNKNLQNKIEFLARERVDKVNWPRILTAINANLPKDVWINKMILSQRDESRVAGSTYNNALVSSFLSNLESSPHFDRVKFNYTEKAELDGRNIVNFELAFTLSGNGEGEE